jgi:hypothetical protein
MVTRRSPAGTSEMNPVNAIAPWRPAREDCAPARLKLRSVTIDDITLSRLLVVE